MTDPEVGAAVYAVMVLLENAREQTPPGLPVRLSLGANQAASLANRLDWACEALGVYAGGVDSCQLTVDSADGPAGLSTVNCQLSTPAPPDPGDLACEVEDIPLPKPPRWALPARRG